MKFPGPTILAVDNQAAIKIAENIGVTARNKHFKDCIHYFRHQVEHLCISPVFVCTADQLADGFTKALTKTDFRNWADKIVHTLGRMGLIKAIERRRAKYRDDKCGDPHRR